MNNIEEELANELAKEIAESIDWRILSDIYVSSGFTKVELDIPTFREQEVKEWAEHYCQDIFYCRGNVFVFKNVKDANWFKLKWLV